MSTPMVVKEQWCFDNLAGREMTVNELHKLTPIHVCPGWEQYDMGAPDPATGLRGYREWSTQTVYQALERLRLGGKVERRRERERGERGHPSYVYFRLAAAVEPPETARRSEGGPEL